LRPVEKRWEELKRVELRWEETNCQKNLKKRDCLRKSCEELRSDGHSSKN
jgi:hypothetical protein